MTEPSVSLSVRNREGGEYIDIEWLPDSGVYRTIIAESLYNKLLKLALRMKLQKNKSKFTAYGSTQNPAVLGRVKLVLKNANGLKVKLMAYIVQGVRSHC